jgi:hypothetical protein
MIYMIWDVHRDSWLFTRAPMKHKEFWASSGPNVEQILLRPMWASSQHAHSMLREKR